MECRGYRFIYAKRRDVSVIIHIRFGRIGPVLMSSARDIQIAGQRAQADVESAGGLMLTITRVRPQY